jgi:flagellar biosynthesis protein FlhB
MTTFGQASTSTDVVGGITSLVGSLATLGVGIYSAQQEANFLKEQARTPPPMPAYAPQQVVQKSNTGLIIGIVVVMMFMMMGMMFMMKSKEDD